MSLRIRIIGSTLVLVGLLGPAFSQELPRDVAKRVKRSTAYVDGKNGHGSGFVVQANVVATNSHVIRDEDLEKLTLRFVDDSGVEHKHQVQLLYEDVARDLVLLRVTKPLEGRPELEIAGTFDTTRRPDVYIIGNPGQVVEGLSLVNSIGKAKCQDTLAMLWGQPFIQLTCERTSDDTSGNTNAAGRADRELNLRQIRELTRAIKVGPGNSGGPVVDQTGKVVGILSAGLTNKLTKRPSGQFYCIPSSALKMGIDQLGPAAQWEERVRATTGRHYLVESMTNAYIQAKVAEAIIEARHKLAVNLVPNRAAYQLDKDVIEAYQTLDKELRAKSATSIKYAKSNPELSRAYKTQIEEHLEMVDSLRSTARRASFDGSDYRQAQGKVAKCNERFGRFCRENNVPKQMVDDLLKARLPIVEGQD